MPVWNGSKGDSGRKSPATPLLVTSSTRILRMNRTALDVLYGSPGLLLTVGAVSLGCRTAVVEPLPAPVVEVTPAPTPPPFVPSSPLAQLAHDAALWLARHPQPMPTALSIAPERTQRSLELVAASTDVAATLATFERIPVAAVDKPTSWGSPDRFRMTRYLVYESPGSAVRTEVYDTALHATPKQGLEGLTRQAVYAGALDDQKTALVWLTRRDANRAMMQGTVDVRFADGAHRVFNVHENNGIAYDRSIRDSNEQARFWSFREVQGVLGYGEDDKIPLQPLLAVAGDVPAFGAGRLFALVDGPDEYIVVLADTGGAFVDNRHQLDWFTGSHASHEAFLAVTGSLPHHVDVFALVAPN